MRYAFVAEHRPLFSVRAMCRCLRIHPSGFCAWLKNPLSKRAREDARQTELIRHAWQESGKVYGYRKLHDDLLDQGETCCPNRVVRLTSMAGIKAQIGYKRRSVAYGGKPSVVVANTLNRQFDVEAPDRVCPYGDASIAYRVTGDRHHLYPDAGRLRLLGGRDRSLLPPRRRLVNAKPSNDRRCPAGAAYGRVATKAEDKSADPFGSRLPVHQHGLGVLPETSQSGTLNEPTRQLPRQCRG